MTGYTITFTVADQRITASEHTVPVSDTLGYLHAEFRFDSSWNSLVKSAVFIGVRNGMNLSSGRGAHTVCTVPLDSNDRCPFPAEVLSSEHSILLVGALGYTADGESRLTTDTCTVRQEQSCYRTNATPHPPAPDLYADMLRTAESARLLAEELNTNAAIGAYNGRDGQTPYIGADGHWHIGLEDTEVQAVGHDGLTPHIGADGHWYIGLEDTGVQAEGRNGENGLLPLSQAAFINGGVCTLPANHMTVLSNIAGTVTVTLGPRLNDFDNEWAVQIGMLAAYEVILPTTRWPLGIAPTFAANTTTIIRWYYVGSTLCGEWVTV